VSDVENGSGPASLSVKDKIRQAKRPTRTVDICLDSGLQEEYEQLHEQLLRARELDAVDKRLGSGAEARRLAEQIVELQKRMAEFVITFRLGAIGPKAWDALQRAYPPREGNPDDELAGYNIVAFSAAAIRACTISPQLDDEDWRELLGEGDQDGKLTPKQYADLNDAVLALNVRKISVPNSLAASTILRSSEPE